MTLEEALEWNNNSHDIDYNNGAEDMRESTEYLIKRIFSEFDKASEDIIFVWNKDGNNIDEILLQNIPDTLMVDFNKDYEVFIKEKTI